ncbi:hypothetical protein Acr_20g0011000 [Actinidia rufa]|uniref:Exostosin GT47 domain-containing protein n=1 Tax=Actinidia rufa TaxID=165716 RepID=A0A7J0GEY8_9ERIC|nr:hypothetical protein Acr_20g0011000 [Actinidia rufa]
MLRPSSFCESEIDLEVTKSVEEQLMASLRSVFQNREQVIGVQLHQWREREEYPQISVKLGLISRLRERVSAVGLQRCKYGRGCSSYPQHWLSSLLSPFSSTSRRPPISSFTPTKPVSNSSNQLNFLRFLSRPISSIVQIPLQKPPKTSRKPAEIDGAERSVADQMGSNGDFVNNNGVLHDRDVFLENYKEMNKSFKIYVYPCNKSDSFAHAFLPVDFEPGGNYASESYFKKVLLNSHFITKDPSKADLFFMPFSIARLRHDPRIGVEGLQDFIGDYIFNISQRYPYWNRTGGADHFYVACHSIGRSAMEKAEEVKLNAIQVVCSSSYFLSGYVAHKDASLPQIWPRREEPPGLASSKSCMESRTAPGPIVNLPLSEMAPGEFSVSTSHIVAIVVGGGVLSLVRQFRVLGAAYQLIQLELGRGTAIYFMTSWKVRFQAKTSLGVRRWTTHAVSFSKGIERGVKFSNALIFGESKTRIVILTVFAFTSHIIVVLSLSLQLLWFSCVFDKYEKDPTQIRTSTCVVSNGCVAAHSLSPTSLVQLCPMGTRRIRHGSRTCVVSCRVDMGVAAQSAEEKLAFFAGSINSPVRQKLLQEWEKRLRDLCPFRSAQNTLRQRASWEQVLSPHILNWKSFSIVVATLDIPLLKEILKGVSSKEYLELQSNVLKVRRHFQWHFPPTDYDAFYMVMYELWLRRSFIRVPLGALGDSIG